METGVANVALPPAWYENTWFWKILKAASLEPPVPGLLPLQITSQLVNEKATDLCKAQPGNIQLDL